MIWSLHGFLNCLGCASVILHIYSRVEEIYIHITMINILCANPTFVSPIILTYVCIRYNYTYLYLFILLYLFVLEILNVYHRYHVPTKL